MEINWISRVQVASARPLLIPSQGMDATGTLSVQMSVPALAAASGIHRWMLMHNDAEIHRLRSLVSSYNYGIKKRHYDNGDVANRIAGTAYV
jgi:hypothetical protein